MPDEVKNFGVSLVLDFGKWCRHVKTIYKFYRIYSSVRSSKKNMCRNICLFACRFACSWGHSCMRNGRWKTRQTFSFIDFKDVVSELALYAESKMIIFTSGPLQGFT